MTIQKKDFIEIEFTGRVKDGEIFDSNIKEDLKKLSPNTEAKPLVFCVGEKMFLDSIDEFLIGKELGNYKIELSPEKAFGNRNSSLVKLMPMNLFREKQIRPMAGMVLNFDNMIGKIISVSGGRVMVDFNNPLAGKIVIYDIKILKKVEELNEKVKALMQFFFQKEFKFEIKEKKLLVEAEKPFVKYIELFKVKFKEILDLDLEVKEIEVKETEVKEHQNPI